MLRQTRSERPTDGSCNPPSRQSHGQGSKQVPAGGSSSGGGRDSGGGGGGSRNQKCYKCDKYGHIARDCPEKYDERRGSSQVPKAGGSQQRQDGYQGAAKGGGSGGGGGPPPPSQGPNSSQSSSQTLKMKLDENALLTNFINVNRTAVKMPYRPDYGALGEEVEIIANYFSMEMKGDLTLNSYDIKFAAIVDDNGEIASDPKGKKLKQIIRIMLDSRDFAAHKKTIVTDFQLKLISLHILPNNIRNQKIVYFHEADGAVRNNAQTYHLHLVPARDFPVLKIADLMEFLRSTARTVDYNAKSSMVQALNILIGHYTNSSSTTSMIGGKKAFPQVTDVQELNAGDLNAGLQALRGFFTSVRLASFRPLINVNLTHGAFYKAIKLPELMEQYGRQNRYQYQALETFVKGLRVRTDYMRDKQGNPITTTRIIFGFAQKFDGGGQTPPPIIEEYAGSPFQVWFHLKDDMEFVKLTTGKNRKDSAGGAGSTQRQMLEEEHGRGRNYISVCEFFGENYGIWSDPEQRYPVVNFGSRKDPKYVPAEACSVEPGQLSRLKLSSAQTTSMLGFAKLKPSEVVKKIAPEGVRTMGLIPQSPQMIGFGVTVDMSMVKVVGRILSPPKLKYRKEKAVSSSDGMWNLRDGVQFNTSPPLGSWRYLAIESTKAKKSRTVRDHNDLKPSIDSLRKALSTSGVETQSLPNGLTVDIAGPKDNLLAQSIEEAAKKKPAILLVVLPEKDTILYNNIKQLADVRYGISTICVVGWKFFSCKADYGANVALKINLKLGGINHLLSDHLDNNAKRVTLISEDKTMVVGIDVTHPGPGTANPSIAAMVASIDSNLAQWPADLKVQIRTRQEMVTLLGDMLRSRLLLWKKHHGVYPENILVYRDGVSESQYEQVLNDEFSPMRNACPDLYSKTNQQPPRFTIVIVGKRHHTRFFAPLGSPARDKSTNPKCGLVVDRGITEARSWDFFLQSHASHLGTARPSHYFVLWDEIFTNRESSADGSRIPPADMLEQVTHDMCYLYGRSTKAVSLCPPVYYADIACDRAARYLAIDSYGSESGRSESEMSEGERERVRSDLQRKIEVHENLKETMFYI